MPNRGIDGIAEQPGFIERFLFPCPRWCHAAADGTHWQIVIFAQAKPARHGGNFLDTNFLADRIEKHVAALRDTIFHVQSAMTLLFPTVKPIVGNFKMSGAKNRIIWAQHPIFQRREGCDHLKG